MELVKVFFRVDHHIKERVGIALRYSNPPSDKLALLPYRHDHDS